MERIFRPWRGEYVTSAAKGPPEACFLCEAAAGDGEGAALVAARRGETFVILNRYPYNPGHVMVAPVRHAGDIGDLTPGERSAVMDLVAEAVAALRDEYGPDGFNIGANLGRVAGAGLPGHFHVHVVPRWNGDTNFMPVVGETKVLPESLEETLRRLAPRLA